jgi:hypothetical protein
MRTINIAIANKRRIRAFVVKPKISRIMPKQAKMKAIGLKGVIVVNEGNGVNSIHGIVIWRKK